MNSTVSSSENTPQFITTVRQKISLKDMNTLFGSLLNEMMKPHGFNRELLFRCKELISFKLEGLDSTELENSMQSEEERIFNSFCELINLNYAEMRKVNKYSSRMGVSSRKLTTCCLKLTGKSAKTLIDEKLIRESRHTLFYTTRPVKYIAANLGFADQYQFSKFFKKHTAASPKQFRNRTTSFHQ